MGTNHTGLDSYHIHATDRPWVALKNDGIVVRTPNARRS